MAAWQGGRLVAALLLVLLLPRGVQHRRLGPERAARDERPGALDADAVHARRRRRAAGAAGLRVPRQGVEDGGARLQRRAADRDRGLQRGRRGGRPCSCCSGTTDFRSIIRRGEEERRAAERESAEAAENRAGGLGQALAGLAHERHGLGEDQPDRVADLGRLLLRRAGEVDRVDRGDRHVDGELDRVVRPCDALRALHLLGELAQPALEVVGVAEHAAEGVGAFHATHCMTGRPAAG